jgi:hypothetical protein
MLPRLTRRQWNNVIIVACIVFIGALNLPTLIKTFLIEAPADSGYPYVLNPSVQPISIELPHLSIEHDGSEWRSDSLSHLQATELVQRWRALVGTELTHEQYQQLSSTLGAPSSVEVWYVDIEEPQRITLYELEQFWLFNSWEGRWIAVSVEGDYLAL